MMRRTPMKRSGFASQWQPRSRPERTERTITLRPIRVPAPAAPVFNPQPKHEYIRDEGYRRYVASHDCFRCGIAGISQAAHANSAAAGKGMGIKASDEALFPLCATTPDRPGCHDEHDQARDDLSRDERRDQEIEWIARMESIAALEGYQTPKRREQ